MHKDAEIYKKRRDHLRASLASFGPHDTILLCAAAEPSYSRFVQDSTFYYYTGINEPAAVVCLEGSGAEYLFVPAYAGIRNQWVAHELTTESDCTVYGVDAIRYQGAPVGGYTLRPFANPAVYRDLMSYLVERSCADGFFYIAGGSRWYGSYGEQLWWYMGQQIAQFTARLVDVSAVIASMRRSKDAYELACIRQAITITAAGQRAAAAMMHAGKKEYEIRAAIEGAFMSAGSEHTAFPSIVATGINATILHYLNADAVLQSGDAVVVDIGATYRQYAADITRTYCVDGVVSSRYKELYTIVLDTQQYVASLARPGVYLNNHTDPDNSLHHHARAYLDRYGYAHYMPHGIGHFMGLDVHDVGDRLVPLAPGDVITIEPGIYIADEKIGIRIEDNYLITETGVECLSTEIAKELK